MYRRRKKEDNFNPKEWDYTEENGKIVLNSYKGHDRFVTFPKGEKYTISRSFSWAALGHTVWSIDFNNIEMQEGFITDIFYGLNIHQIKNASNTLRNIDFLFNNNTFITPIIIGGLDKVTSCTSAFKDSKIARPVKINGNFNTMEKTYDGCIVLSDPGEIPKSVKYLIGTYENSGIERGLDLSEHNVIVMDRTYNRCVGLIDGGNLCNSIIEMYKTYNNCFNMKNGPEKLPENAICLSGVFNNCGRMKKFPKIPKNVQILNNLFAGCCKATNVQEIPYGAISVCGIYSKCGMITVGADIPDTVIDARTAYMDCYGLRRGVKLGHSLISADHMYCRCSVLVWAPDLPDNVKFACGMFEECYRLVKPPKLGKVVVINRIFRKCVTMQYAPIIPETVESMDEAFMECDNLSGDIIILSKNVFEAKNILQGTDGSKYHKRIFIPFNSITYETFERNGYLAPLTQSRFNFEVLPLEELENERAL